MRRRSFRARVALCVAVLSLVPAGGAVRALADPTVPFLPRACTPEGPLDIARPGECQRTTYKYGPLHVTPGDNLILFGPVTVEKPMTDGFVLRFKPGMELVDGSVPGIEVIHLHHAVWQSTAFGDPMFASGEEKTTIALPNGYGLPVKPTDGWLLNYMVHNQTPSTYDVFVTYDIDFVPRASITGATTKQVEPHWLDVGKFNGFNPIYNTKRGYGALRAGECSFPKEQCADADPYGKRVTGNGDAGNGLGLTQSMPAGTIVFALGHVHPGGLRTDVEMIRGGVRKRVFTSDAVYYDPNGPVSWDMSMEATRSDYRLRVNGGDTLVLNSVYETSRASWYEGMGIVITFLARGDTSGSDPFTNPAFNPDNAAVTHGHMDEATNHGGPDRGSLDASPSLDISTVVVGGFVNAPGDLGLRAAGTPTVKRGTSLRFVNADAGAQVFHTITACAAPCNGATGISYPLANGPVDFDSLELGFGPSPATAASNRADFTLPTTAMSAGTYTYFCRVHPFMRGAFAVTP